MGMYSIKMPDIGEGIAEVELVAWRVRLGDTVEEDQVLADVMTDKATVEIPAPVRGTVAALGGEPGQVMAVGSELIRLEVQGEGNLTGSRESHGAVGAAQAAAGQAPAREAARDTAHEERALEPAQALAREAGTPPIREHARAQTAEPALPHPSPARTHAETAGARSEAPPRPRDERAPGKPGVAPAHTRAPGERPIASPAVRRRAWDLGIELQFVHGSGPAGRITHEDLDVYLAARGQAPVVGTSGLRQRHGEEAVPVIGLRRKIAQKMQEAKRRIPHFSYVEEIDVTEVEALRVQLNARFGASRGKLTLLPFIARAMVVALDEFPQMNARFDDDAGVVTRLHPVHLGVATQTDAGLLVPVVRHAEALDLWGIAREVARLAEAARSGKAAREELSGSSITLTSLGALGGIASTPVINHPEVAIVGVNRIVERPVFVGTSVVARQLMNLSSSFDHRVVDGMDAARFIQAVRALLERPALLFVE
ncbi:dihydrolipoamide acetyltransferase family protein [Ramlibacter sp. AN1015]|uniref:dihydrolipoamide acetyltransferase family protein n=1 Tax=Ramlibacter sp. AN1015 TaxID=3133428 RepID=UPI0030BFB708